MPEQFARDRAGQLRRPRQARVSMRRADESLRWRCPCLGTSDGSGLTDPYRMMALSPSLATEGLYDRRRESGGMTRVRRSDEVAIDDDRRILHPGCTGGFRVGLHDQFGIRRAVIEPGHAAASNDLRAGGQHRPSADASDDSASSADVLHELGYA